MRSWQLITLSIALAALAPHIAAAAEPGGAGSPKEEPPFNIPLKTLGGRQVWSDVALLDDWRIQENLLTGHCRLLDGADIRRAWGDMHDCIAALTSARSEFALSFDGPHLVLLLHGLGRNRQSLAKLQSRLGRAGFQARALAYASTRGSLQEHAGNLLRVLDSLETIETVSFVTHSLGALVVRTALANQTDWPAGLKVDGLVMLAPPSNGAELADRLQRFTPWRLIGGPSTGQLGHEAAGEIALPKVRHCIIAGGRGDGEGYNPLIEGDDDGIVGVEEARLRGSDDLLIVKSLHTVIMNNAGAVEATIRFLNKGRCSAAN